MPKIAKRYLEADPYKIIEVGFHQDRAMVSESIFSLGNEYSGVRGYFEEGYSGEHLQGSYFNGIYEYALLDTPNAYLGIVKRTHFTINAVNYLKTSITIDDEVLDLHNATISDFYRELDMRNGLYLRKFKWLKHHKTIDLTFKRILNMQKCEEAYQEITIKPNQDITLDLVLSLDSNVLHWNSDCYFKRDQEFIKNNYLGISVETLTTKQKIVSLMHLNIKPDKITKDNMVINAHYHLTLKANEEITFKRQVANVIDKYGQKDSISLINEATSIMDDMVKKDLHDLIQENEVFFKNIYDASDIEIDGDIFVQQGIRYSIFQLAQTYHGYSGDNNIGAKGLTGEAYSGHAFWDSETYCLPYYLFSNKEASLNLLMFRYNTLNEARKRARELDCLGACYPIATRNGKEGCNLWQHASLQFQPTTGVYYAIMHYMNIYNDIDFMNKYGLEMLVEICRFLLSRGAYNQDRTKFGLFGVMGPDEFQMMVNHNTYTNYLAQKAFGYLLDILNDDKYDLSVLTKLSFTDEEKVQIQEAHDKMLILYDDKTKLFEQHMGYFDLPHIDINQIPETDFPLYHHWSYDRIYRNDMIKQPDVLMFMFLFNQDFSYEQKLANYLYYEPRCIHESSLSPSIHSILACELNRYDEAYRFFEYATRLDLDDYNCNTKEGIHTTSIAAAWMNIVYGFGGLRSDKKVLKLKPRPVINWNYYSFKIKYQEALIKIKVSKDQLVITTNKTITLNIYDQDYLVLDNLVIDLGA